MAAFFYFLGLTYMDYTIIDVREPYEYALGHVEGAINIPAGSIMESPAALQGLPKDAKLLLYCRSGSRSEYVMILLKQMGFTNMTNGINKERIKATFGI